MLRKTLSSRSLIITAGCTSLLLGLAIVRLPPELWPAMSICACAATLAVVGIRLRNGVLCFSLLMGFLCGIWRGGNFLVRAQELADLNGQTIQATVVADTDGVYGDHSQLMLDGDHIQLREPYQASLPGAIQVAGFGETAVYKGDQVVVSGKVKKSRGSKQLRMSFADITVIKRSHAPIDQLRRRFAAGMQSALPEPHASFAMGLLIGQKSTLPQEMSILLSAVGLTHIIAVSGYNLTIIAEANKKLLKRGSKYQITVGTAVLILLFVCVTGFSASIIRAALVSYISLAAWYYGRRFKPLVLISLTAALTAAWNPFYLWSDIGWYLSFLAFFGVMVMGPLVNKRLYDDHEPGAMKALVTESVCAIVMTLPFTMYIFQQVSLIALVANLLVVPFVPLSMLLVLVVGMVGMMAASIAGWFAWPARLLLTYMLDVVTLLGRLPHVLIHRRLSLWFMLAAYGLVAGMLIILWRKYAQNGTITDIKRSI